MHIFLQIFVREKTLKVPPTKPLVGGDGESRSNGGVGGWGEGGEGLGLNKVCGNIQKTFGIVL